MNPVKISKVSSNKRHMQERTDTELSVEKPLSGWKVLELGQLITGRFLRNLVQRLLKWSLQEKETH